MNMSKTKYLYVDDENDKSVDAIASGFNDLDIINIEISQPLDFKNQIKDFNTRLSNYDGLILDLRLDQNMKLDVSYNAPAIAQEIRTLSSLSDSLKSIPIILCSTDERMRATYDVDQTSHDLFDYKFLKGVDPNWGKFSLKLEALSSGYKWLNEHVATADSILNRADLTGVDYRVIERLEDKERNKTTYDYANFVIKEIFHHPGVLIKERIVAARLGIDIEASGPSWIEFRDNYLKYSKYTGMFSNGWERWWSDKVVTFFKEISGGKRLSSINAESRVKILSDVLSISGLVPATAIPYCKSTNFWTICEESKMPLDPLEGFKVYESVDIKSWQEHKYLSFNAIAVDGIPKHKGLRPQQSELNRIQLMKENISDKKNENRAV